METHFRQEHNRASILLSLIRTRLTSSEYRSLLLVQNWADQWFHSGGLSSEERSLWVSELKARLDDLFRGLEEGRLSRRHLERFLHLYRELFLWG